MKEKTIQLYLQLKTAKANQGIAPLYIRIQNPGHTRFEINTGIRMPLHLWNQKSQSLHNPHKNREIQKDINNYLNRIEEAHQRLSSTRGIYSPQAFKKIMKGPEKKIEQRPSFTYIYKKHLDIEGAELAPGTWKNYRSTNHMFLKFLAEEYKLIDIDLMEINRKVMIEFMSWLKQKPAGKYKKCALAGAQKHYERINKLLNFAVTMQYIEFNPASGIRKKHIPKERTCLSKEELQTLMQHPFQDKKMAETRDIFIFSCYTGLSYADTFTLTPDDIIVDIYNKPAIHKIRQKTHRSREIKFYVPLLDIALEIIKRYQEHTTCKIKGTLLPVKCNIEYNRILKLIAKETRITKNLTTHVARHTFATTITQDNGISLEAISQMLGHTQIKTTQIYSKTTMMRVYSEMKNLKTKLNPEQNTGFSTG